MFYMKQLSLWGRGWITHHYVYFRQGSLLPLPHTATCAAQAWGMEVDGGEEPGFKTLCLDLEPTCPQLVYP